MNSLTQTRGSLLEDVDFASALHHLARYHTDDGVLSVYVDLAPGADRERAVRELLAPLHYHTNDAWLQGRLEYEIEGVIQTIRAWQQPPARAVAMFFCGPGGLDTVVPLRFAIQSFARFARRPVLSPLISMLDEHRRYCVVMLDRRRARIVSVMFGEVEEEVSFESDRNSMRERVWRAEGGASLRREGELHAHAMRVVEHLWVIDRSRPIHGLVLSGDEDALQMLRRLLPPTLSRGVVQWPDPFDMDLTGPDIAHRVHVIEQAAREDEDETLVTRIREERDGDLTVKGWGPTLAATNAGRVQTLLLPGDVARAGVFCGQDHFVALEARPTCPTCGAELRPTEHVGEAAARAVLLTDGQVRVLATRAASDLRPFGAAAILRY